MLALGFPACLGEPSGRTPLASCRLLPSAVSTMALTDTALADCLASLGTLDVPVDDLPPSMIEAVPSVPTGSLSAEHLQELGTALAGNAGDAVWQAFAQVDPAAHIKLLVQLHNCVVADGFDAIQVSAAGVYFCLLHSPGRLAGVWQSFTFRSAARTLRDAVESAQTELAKKGSSDDVYESDSVAAISFALRSLSSLLACGAFSLALTADLLPQLVSTIAAAMSLAAFPALGDIPSITEDAMVHVVHARHGEVTMVSRLVMKALKDVLVQGSARRRVQLAGTRVLERLLSWTPPPPLQGTTVSLPSAPWTVPVVEAMSPEQRASAGDDAILPLSVWERLPGAAALAQHLCVGTPDRADARAVAADAVVSVYTLLPHNLRRHFTRFLGRLCTHRKAGFRAMGVEVLSSLLVQCSGTVWMDDAQANAAQAHLARAMPTPDDSDDEEADDEEGAFSSPRGKLASPVTSRPASARRSMGGGSACASPFTPFPSLTPHSGGGSLSPGAPLLSVETVGDGPGIATAVVLLDMLVRRVSDKSPSVRAKALAALCDVMLVTEAMPAAPAVGRGAAALVALNCVMAHRQGAEEGTAPGRTGTSSILAKDGSFSLLPLLIKRMDDERSHVRRAAIQAIVTAAQLGGQCFASIADALPVQEGVTLAELQEAAEKTLMQPPSRCVGAYALQVMATKCDDSSVLVRKAAMAALSDILVLEPGTPCVQEAWLAGVLPIACSNEASEAARAAECFARCALQPILTGESAVAAPAWTMLGSVAMSPDLSTCLSAALQGVLRASDTGAKPSQASIKVASLIKSLRASGAASASHREFTGAWTLLGGLADALAQVGAQLSSATLRAVAPLAGWGWEQALAVMSAPTQDTLPALGDMLRLVATLAAYLPAATAAAASAKLATALCRASTVEALTGDALSAAVHATAATAFATGGAGAQEWHADVVAAIEKALSSSVGSSGQRNEALALKYLSVLGELALLGVTPDSDDDKATAPAAASTALSEGARKLACGDCSKLPRAAISAHVVTLVQALVMPGSSDGSTSVDATMVTMGTAATGLGSASRARQLRAHAFITLGKLCLRDSSLAKRMVPALVRELVSASTPVSVRCNSLIILADLCCRYTSMVDRYIPDIAACLRDDHPLVRRQALGVLTQLLAQDYVKWRGPLFYRYVACLVDSDEGVRGLATAALSGPLLTKNPHLLSSHFVDTLFVLTGCESHPAARDVIAQLKASVGLRKDGGSAAAAWSNLAMPGQSGQRLRATVYSRLLGLMTPEQRLTVASKLTLDVLGAVVDGTMPLEEGGSAALGTPCGAGSDENMTTTDLCKEVFSILRSKDIRSGVAAGAGEADAGTVPAPEGVELGGAAAVAAGLEAAKSRLLGKMARKHTVENLVPVLVALRGVLLERRSPLIGELTRYLRLLWRECGDDIQDALASDPQLLAELKYDMEHMQGGRSARGLAARARDSMGGAAPAQELFAAAGAGSDTPATQRTLPRSPASPPNSAPPVGGAAAALASTPTPRVKRARVAKASPVVQSRKGKRRLEPVDGGSAAGLAALAAPKAVLMPSPAANSSEETPRQWPVTPASKRARPEAGRAPDAAEG